MAKHTPGEWNAVLNHGGRGQPGWYTVEALAPDGSRTVVVADTRDCDSAIGPDEERANAMLLGAAPAMAALLRKIADPRDERWGYALQHEARALLARIDGPLTEQEN